MARCTLTCSLMPDLQCLEEEGHPPGECAFDAQAFLRAGGTITGAVFETGEPPLGGGPPLEAPQVIEFDPPIGPVVP